MTHEGFAQIKECFQRALELPGSEREAFVRACCGSEEAFQAVMQLLRAEEEAGAFLEEAWLRRVDVPREIGPYRVEREIGRGGMATVFLARRADDLYEKQVAIKLLDRPVWRQDEVSRFQKEIRILASLSHPHIVGLLEGNRAEDGRLFIVMEYVAGELLSEWRRVGNRSVDEVLRVFLQIAEAVAYAHRNLIVHRDLKPSNVMVTAEGQAKLLDFGIAKLLEDDDDTATGLGRMTVAYASPEQIRGSRNITVATDVYSLGVMLYELLTGQWPYGEGEGSGPAAMRAVLENEAKPPRSWNAAVPRELEAVVLKALRKDASERYATVDELRQDCERFLTGMPVEAMRGGNAYRIGKFAARHRTSLAIAVVVFGGAVFGVASVLHYARQAETRMRGLVLVNEAIIGELWLMPGRQEAELRLLEKSAQALEPVFEATQSIEAANALYTASVEIGRTRGYPSVRGIGDTAGAERALRRATQLAEWMLRLDPTDTGHRARLADALCMLGAILIEQNRYSEAEVPIARAVEVTRSKAGEQNSLELGGAHSEALAHLSRIHLHNGNREECLRLRREAVAVAREFHERMPDAGNLVYMLAGRLGLLGWAQREFGDAEGAVASYEESQELLRKNVKFHVELERRQMELSNHHQLGLVWRAKGQGEKARASFRMAVDGYRKLLRDDPMSVGCQRGLAASLAHLAVEELDAARASEALRIMRDVVRRDPANRKAAEELREYESMLRGVALASR